MTRSGHVYASYFYRKIQPSALAEDAVPCRKPHSKRHCYGIPVALCGRP
ncbi:hypothetical protein [Streptomyces sp. NPDC088184]